MGDRRKGAENREEVERGGEGRRVRKREESGQKSVKQRSAIRKERWESGGNDSEDWLEVRNANK